MLTDEKRRQIRFNLLMDDNSPLKVMSLSDEELIKIDEANAKYFNELWEKSHE